MINTYVSVVFGKRMMHIESVHVNNGSVDGQLGSVGFRLRKAGTSLEIKMNKSIPCTWLHFTRANSGIYL